ncbi:MAG TPA: hypothetical protein VMM84_18635 [Pyrinomonadaceae bacterium]|nr:hypothetical protein [Pyrinomonadaceae bacterium]
MDGKTDEATPGKSVADNPDSPGQQTETCNPELVPSVATIRPVTYSVTNQFDTIRDAGYHAFLETNIYR